MAKVCSGAVELVGSIPDSVSVAGEEGTLLSQDHQEVRPMRIWGERPTGWVWWFGLGFGLMNLGPTFILSHSTPSKQPMLNNPNGRPNSRPNDLNPKCLPKS